MAEEKHTDKLEVLGIILGSLCLHLHWIPDGQVIDQPKLEAPNLSLAELEQGRWWQGNRGWIPVPRAMFETALLPPPGKWPGRVLFHAVPVTKSLQNPEALLHWTHMVRSIQWPKPTVPCPGI